MKTTDILLILFFLMQISCSPVEKNNGKTELSGLFINLTLLDSLNPDKVLWQVPRFCEELQFLKNDTIEVNNIFEKGLYHYRKSEMENYNLEITSRKPLPFSLHHDELFFWDEAFLKTGKKNVFKKSKTGFVELLNEKIITGKYTYTEGVIKETITFKSNGNIKNWKKFSQYEICLAGDCADMSDIPVNMIYLSGNSTGDFFAWKMSNSSEGKQLILYPLSPEDPEIKGDRKILNDSIVLIKIQ